MIWRRLSGGWRLGFIIGHDVARVWLGKWIWTIVAAKHEEGYGDPSPWERFTRALWSLGYRFRRAANGGTNG